MTEKLNQISEIDIFYCESWGPIQQAVPEQVVKKYALVERTVIFFELAR